MFKKNKDGQALVELALVFPLFMLIIIGGIIDFGFALYNVITLQQIANDTAQWATDRRITDDNEIQLHVLDLKPDRWTTDIRVEPVVIAQMQDDPSQTLEIDISFDSPVYTPFYQTVVQTVSGVSYIPIRAKAVYRLPTVLQSY